MKTRRIFQVIRKLLNQREGKIKRTSHDVAWETDGPYAAVALDLHTQPLSARQGVPVQCTHPSPAFFLLYTIRSMHDWSNAPVKSVAFKVMQNLLYFRAILFKKQKSLYIFKVKCPLHSEKSRKVSIFLEKCGFWEKL